MKRFCVLATVLVSASLSARADLTRLASARVNSMNELGASASAVAIMAEQPMMGMMAMGALQQGAMGTFGTIDQTKPMAAVLYTKAPLPNFGEMIGGEEMDDFMAAGTNLAYVVLVPLSQTADEYLKSRGATNEVNGAFKTDAEMYIVCKDGYAVCSNDPEAAKVAAGEIAKTLVPKLNGMVVEMTVGKILMEKYGEIMKKGMEMSQDLAGASPVTNALEVAMKQYQKASMESMIGMMSQLDEGSLGLNYDITAGLTFDMAFRFVKGSELEGLVKNATPVSPAMYAAVPAGADVFMLVGDVSDSSYDSKKSIKLISETLVKEIKDAEVRAKAESIIAGYMWMMSNVGETVGFMDRDKAGRMVFVSKAKSKDNAKYLEYGKSMNADGIAILNKYFPGQKALAYDQKAETSSIDFAEGIQMLVAKFGEGDEDAEGIEVGLKGIDAVMGRKMESVTKISDGYLSSVCKAVGSDYAGPAKSDPAAVSSRVKALMPKGSKATPSQVVSVSLGSMLKHYGLKIAKAVGEDGAEMVAVFEGLPEAPVGGITAVVWSEGATMREAVNFSAAECKWFMSFIKACSSLKGDEEDVMEGEAEPEAEVGDFEIMEDGDGAVAPEGKKDAKPADGAVEE